MKSITKRKICNVDTQLLPVGITYNMCVVTSHTRKINEGYMHYFGKQEIVLPSSLVSYKIIIRTKNSTKLSMHSCVRMNAYEPLEDCNDKYVIIKTNQGDFYTVYVNTKNFVIVTKDKTEVYLSIQSCDYIDPYSNIDIVNSKGHFRLKGSTINNVCNQIERPFLQDMSPKVITMISGLEYYQSFGSLITLTSKVNNSYCYPPYSIRVSNGSTVYYRMLLSPSEGDNAEIVVTAIETISHNKYAIISNNKKQLCNKHKGCLVSGSFDIPIGYTDVGLHIYTIYGFSCDIGKDPSTGLLKFEEFCFTV